MSLLAINLWSIDLRVMNSLLKAIRTRLTGDTALTAMVGASDITSSFNAELSNYPCIVLGIDSGGAFSEVSGVAKATLSVDVYSDTHKQQLWTIYERIRILLHNQERSITDTSCVVHVICEVKVGDNQYDLARDVWHLVAQYQILYSTTGLSITTGASGAAYADGESVSATPSKEIAKFRGQVSLDISYESKVRREQERFGKIVYYHTGIARLVFQEVIFKASVLDLLWNISTNQYGTLNDGTTPAATYQVSQGSHPSYLQVLFQMIKTDDGKKLEIEANRAVCQSLSIPFSKTDFSIFDCVWILLGDASGNVVRVALEN
jgi:hypothetical protein